MPLNAKLITQPLYVIGPIVERILWNRLLVLLHNDKNNQILLCVSSSYILHFLEETLHSTAEDSEGAVLKMEDCVADVNKWMSCNFLKLNDSKTEF